MRMVNVHAAKTHLSQLLEQAAAGEEIVIAKAGKPIAKLTAIEAVQRADRVLGLLEGRWKVPDDYDAPLPDDLLDAFEGR